MRERVSEDTASQLGERVSEDNALQLGELSPNSVGRTFSQLLVTLSKFSQLRGSILTSSVSHSLARESTCSP